MKIGGEVAKNRDTLFIASHNDSNIFQDKLRFCTSFLDPERSFNSVPHNIHHRRLQAFIQVDGELSFFRPLTQIFEDWLHEFHSTNHFDE